MGLRAEEIVEFYQIANEIIDNEIFQTLKLHNKNKKLNLYEYSIMVAKRCYLEVKNKDLNVEMMVRGSLLSSYYNLKNNTIDNVKKYFKINFLEENIIKCSNWPFCFIRPKYKEAKILIKVKRKYFFKNIFKRKEV